MPFVKATLLEGHQYGVEKLWSRAFQRRIDDHLEVLRFKPIRDRRFQTCPYGQEYRLGAKEQVRKVADLISLHAKRCGVRRCVLVAKALIPVGA